MRLAKGAIRYWLTGALLAVLDAGAAHILGQVFPVADGAVILAHAGGHIDVGVVIVTEPGADVKHGAPGNFGGDRPSPDGFEVPDLDLEGPILSCKLPVVSEDAPWYPALEILEAHDEVVGQLRKELELIAVEGDKLAVHDLVLVGGKHILGVHDDHPILHLGHPGEVPHTDLYLIGLLVHHCHLSLYLESLNIVQPGTDVHRC